VLTEILDERVVSRGLAFARRNGSNFPASLPGNSIGKPRKAAMDKERLKDVDERIWRLNEEVWDLNVVTRTFQGMEFRLFDGWLLDPASGKEPYYTEIFTRDAGGLPTLTASNVNSSALLGIGERRVTPRSSELFTLHEYL
jgi:hypothetical protein